MSGATASAIVATVATVASTAMSMVAQARQQEAQQAQVAYQRQVMANQQQVAEMQANDAIERGKVAENRSRAKTASLLGSQTARLAAQGTDMSCSELDILGDTAAAGEFDALTVRNNAQREAWGYRVKAADIAARANAPGKDDGGLGAARTLLAGVGTVANKWYRAV